MVKRSIGSGLGRTMISTTCLDKRDVLRIFFVKFEPFCGNTKPVERPESRVEHLPRRGAKAAKNEMCDGPPTRCAAPAGQGSGG